MRSVDFGTTRTLGRSRGCASASSAEQTITGVLTPKGLSPQGVDQDDIVIMPYTSAMKRVLGGTTLRNMNVQVGDARQVDPAQQQIISLLRQRHNIRPGRDDDLH